MRRRLAPLTPAHPFHCAQKPPLLHLQGGWARTGGLERAEPPRRDGASAQEVRRAETRPQGGAQSPSLPTREGGMRGRPWVQTGTGCPLWGLDARAPGPGQTRSRVC